MATAKKGNGMTREQAGKLYDDLKEALERKHGKKRVEALLKEEARKATVAKAKAAGAVDSQTAAMMRAAMQTKMPTGSGHQLALLLVILFACLKIGFSVLEVSGIASLEPVQAKQLSPLPRPAFQPGNYSRDEVRLLKTLDARRVKLEERGKKLDAQERDLARRDREFAARLTELRDLSQRLKLERHKTEKKNQAQYDQLASVYGSMNPQEAAQLLEQLDVTIALSLIERMPEKRIGQILALMTPERALTLTRMLSKG